MTLCPNLQPDLVLLNDVLPDIQGLEVCRRLKINPRNRLTPVVLLTATDNGSFSSRAREAGADDYLGTSPHALGSAQPCSISAAIENLYRRTGGIRNLFTFAQTIEARDPFDGGHGARVSSNAVRFGKSLGLSRSDLDTLRIGGLVHDIGKIGIPDAILSKPGPLNHEETRIVEQHPVVGEQICAPLKSFRHVLPLIRNHHERIKWHRVSRRPFRRPNSFDGPHSPDRGYLRCINQLIVPTGRRCRCQERSWCFTKKRIEAGSTNL